MDKDKLPEILTMKQACDLLNVLLKTLVYSHPVRPLDKYIRICYLYNWLDNLH